MKMQANDHDDGNTTSTRVRFAGTRSHSRRNDQHFLRIPLLAVCGLLLTAGSNPAFGQVNPFFPQCQGPSCPALVSDVGSAGVAGEEPGHVVKTLSFPRHTVECLHGIWPSGSVASWCLQTYINNDVASAEGTIYYEGDTGGEALLVSFTYDEDTVTITLRSAEHMFWDSGEKAYYILVQGTQTHEIPVNSNLGYPGNAGSGVGWPTQACLATMTQYPGVCPNEEALAESYHAMSWSTAFSISEDGVLAVSPGGPPVRQPFQPYEPLTLLGHTVVPGPTGDPVDPTLPGPCGALNCTWKISLAGQDVPFAIVQGRDLNISEMAPGDYILTLKATDASGAENTVRTVILHVPDFSPVAVATANPSPGVVGGPITLDGTGSYHHVASRQIIQWDWDFDGNGLADASGATATTSFSTTGLHRVTLRVTDDNVPPKTAVTTVDVIVTSPPQVACSPNRTLECAPLSGVPVAVEASVTDPGPGETLPVTLKEGATILGSVTMHAPAQDAQVAFDPVTMLPGQHRLSIEVNDGVDFASCSTSVAVVRDTQAPIITCPASIVVGNDPGKGGAAVTWTQPTASDNCGVQSAVGTPPSGTFFPIGTASVRYVVTDTSGNEAECSFGVTVQDREAPKVSSSVAIPVLWPPNGDLRNVGLAASALDNWDGAVPVTVQVFSDEAEWAPDNGDFSPDAKDMVVGALRLRAERRGNGDGRVYLVVAAAADRAGNTAFACSTVTVPHDQSGASKGSVMAQAAAAQTFCQSHNGTPPAGYFVIGKGPIVGPKQ